MSTYDEFVQDERSQRLLEEESLILQGAELIAQLLEAQGVRRAELAERIGRTPSYVTQLLSGSRNMTLRTLAASCAALGARVNLKAVPLQMDSKGLRRVYQFTGVVPQRQNQSLKIEGSVPPQCSSKSAADPNGGVMSIVIRQTEKDLQASLDLHSQAELVGLRVDSCKMESGGLCPGSNSEQLHFEIKFGFANANFDQDNHLLTLSYEFFLRGQQREQEKSLIVECSFLADYLYSGSKKPSQQRISAFAEGNGIMNAWPFAREFFQSALQRMGFPQPPLPFLRLVSDSGAVMGRPAGADNRPVSEKRTRAKVAKH